MPPTLSRLSRELYLDFLEQATARDLEFVRFRDLGPGAPGPSSRYAALRHDVDFAPEYSLEMAELEHDAGVVATYFVLVDGQFYNPGDPVFIRQVRGIRDLGHEVGLHFAISTAAHADLGEEVAFRLRLLSEIVGAPVRSFSQHDPVNAGFADIALPPGHERAWMRTPRRASATCCMCPTARCCGATTRSTPRSTRIATSACWPTHIRGSTRRTTTSR